MNEILKNAGINETVFTLRGNKAKLNVLPQNIRNEYDIYKNTRASNMKFASNKEQKYLQNLNHKYNKKYSSLKDITDDMKK